MYFDLWVLHTWHRSFFIVNLCSLDLNAAISMVPVVCVLHERLSTGLCSLADSFLIQAQRVAKEGAQRHVFLIAHEVDDGSLGPGAHILQLLSDHGFIHLLTLFLLLLTIGFDLFFN